MKRFTRRQSMAALLGGGAAVGLLGMGWAASDEGDLVRSILGRVVGPFTMPDGEFARFLADLGTWRGTAGDAKFAVYRALLEVTPNGSLQYVPDRLRDQVETYEREVVTKFLTRTNYLQIASPREQVSFVGDNACTSPFAKFGMVPSKQMHQLVSRGG